MLHRIFLTLLLCLAIAPPLPAQEVADRVPPEGASALLTTALSPAAQSALDARAAGRPVRAGDWMVVAANPLAVEAGAEVLRAGGSAADAAVAVQTVLGLVEPQSSGLGGGAFVLWYDAATGALTTLDGRETAPLAATPQLMLDAEGQPLDFFDAVLGGRAVGVPGVPRLLEEMHRRWGQVDWASLFTPAITLAEEGFAVSPRLADLVAGDAERLARFPATRAYFLPDGQPLRAGERLRNPAYADSLRRLASGGAAVFYSGALAEAILTAVRAAPGNPGLLAPADMVLYQVRERPAVCAPYRDREVCGMGPPSSGGVAVAQILGLLAPFDLSALGPESAEAWRLYGDAMRLAFADRGRYLADMDFVPVPVRGLVAPDYLRERARLLERADALPDVAPGRPVFDHALDWGAGMVSEQRGTTHITIVDGSGNVLSMTSSIENAFGSRLMAGGFLLNNQLTDFSFRTHDDGRPVANAAAPGKRPRSSMAPTIVLRDGRPEIALGSPGGSRIIGYVAQALIAMLDWGMDPQQAVAVAHRSNRFGTYELEAGTAAEDQAAALQAMGYATESVAMTSGLHVVAIGPGGLSGGADPRREGIALGD